MIIAFIYREIGGKNIHVGGRHAGSYFRLGGQSNEKGHLKTKKGIFQIFKKARGAIAPLPPASGVPGWRGMVYLHGKR